VQKPLTPRHPFFSTRKGQKSQVFSQQDETLVASVSDVVGAAVERVEPLVERSQRSLALLQTIVVHQRNHCTQQPLKPTTSLTLQQPTSRERLSCNVRTTFLFQHDIPQTGAAKNKQKKVRQKTRDNQNPQNIKIKIKISKRETTKNRHFRRVIFQFKQS
jgi:hypothetical protein